MLSKNAKIESIRRVPLFSGCSKRELADLALIADELRFEAGTTLIEQGATGREFIVVIEGDVEVQKDGKVLAQPAGDKAKFFGEIALLTGGPRTATVTTTSSVRALVITDRAFGRLLRDSPQIQAKVLQSLAGRLEPSAL